MPHTYHVICLSIKYEWLSGVLSLSLSLSLYIYIYIWGKELQLKPKFYSTVVTRPLNNALCACVYMCMFVIGALKHLMWIERSENNIYLLLLYDCMIE